MTQKLVVAADIRFSRGVDFLVSVSRSLKFMMMEYMPKRASTVLYKYLEKFYDIYLICGFTVYLSLMYRNFECLYDSIMGTSYPNTNAAK